VPHPGASRRSQRIRRARGSHRRESDAEWRGHSPRRRDPHGAARAIFGVDRIDEDMRKRYIAHVTELTLGGIVAKE
jgi:hypothetical protein